jgi:hypothetical protein
MLFFTFYQLRQNPHTDAQSEPTHNVDDLTDLAERCEPLLTLALQVDRTPLGLDSKLAEDGLLRDLLEITVMDVNGAQDLLSFLLDGYLRSSASESPNLFVRLFLALFDTSTSLRRYLLSPQSGCGDVLKQVG